MTGEPAEIPSAAAIDHLQPCSLAFAENLVLVPQAIGGDLWPAQPFATHGPNMRLSAFAERMCRTGSTLRDREGELLGTVYVIRETES